MVGVLPQFQPSLNQVAAGLGDVPFEDIYAQSLGGASLHGIFRRWGSSKLPSGQVQRSRWRPHHFPTFRVHRWNGLRPSRPSRHFLSGGGRPSPSVGFGLRGPMGVGVGRGYDCVPNSDSSHSPPGGDIGRFGPRRFLGLSDLSRVLGRGGPGIYPDGVKRDPPH